MITDRTSGVKRPLRDRQLGEGEEEDEDGFAGTQPIFDMEEDKLEELLERVAVKTSEKVGDSLLSKFEARVSKLLEDQDKKYDKKLEFWSEAEWKMPACHNRGPSMESPSSCSRWQVHERPSENFQAVKSAGGVDKSCPDIFYLLDSAVVACHLLGQGRVDAQFRGLGSVANQL